MHQPVALFRRFWWVMALVAFLLAFLVPRLAQAQTSNPPALIVRLMDPDGQGIGDVTIEVTDRSGSQIFARILTNTDGRAIVAMLPTAKVRVRVTGQWNGLTLTQSGADAQ